MFLVKNNLDHHILPNASNDENPIETVWIKLRPKKMPRQFSHIIVCAVYHPPEENNWALFHHLKCNMDKVLEAHPYAGFFIMGDLNGFKDSLLLNSYNSIKQIVTKSTRKSKILDRIFTNMH